ALPLWSRPLLSPATLLFLLLLRRPPRSPLFPYTTLFRSTRFGSRLRASVDDQHVADGLGINVNVIFFSTFAVGSGLAGLGGALGAEVLGLDPTFPFKFMIYFLIVVALGGTSSLTGPLLASLILGIADVAGKYYMPKLGSFIVYAVMIIILLWRPDGLFVKRGAR